MERKFNQSFWGVAEKTLCILFKGGVVDGRKSDNT